MTRKLLVFLTGLLFVITLLSNTTQAQDLPGKRDSITSTILKEKRVIQVVLPAKYKQGSADKYDVLYVLDGDWNTKTMMQVQQFVESEAYMPPTIIVGVLNTDRDRDFLPTHSANTSTSGGADKFLSFLKTELIPYVDKTYPSNGDNTLFGHSYGGVFVTYALLNEPQLFKSYIAADPSFWYDNGVMRKQIKDKIAGLANLGKTFYITGREGEGFIGMGIPPVDTILRNNAPAGLTWKITAYPDETHGSVRFKSMYDGLKFSYKGFSSKPIAFHPMTGTMLKNKPITLFYFDDPSKATYTTDGTEPLPTSAKMQKIITISKPGTVKVKVFSVRDRYSKAVSGEFKEGPVAPALTKVKNAKPGGLHYAYYEGDWSKLPDFKMLKPVKEGVTDSAFSIDKLPKQNNFGLVIDGWMEVKEVGYYIFGISSDDGAKFYLNNQLLFDNDGLHSSEDIKSYVMPLQKGFYPVRLEYFQKDGGRDLKLVYITPSNQTLQPVGIPFSLQYSVR